MRAALGRGNLPEAGLRSQGKGFSQEKHNEKHLGTPAEEEKTKPPPRLDSTSLHYTHTRPRLLLLLPPAEELPQGKPETRGRQAGGSTRTIYMRDPCIKATEKEKSYNHSTAPARLRAAGAPAALLLRLAVPFWSKAEAFF